MSDLVELVFRPPAHVARRDEGRVAFDVLVADGGVNQAATAARLRVVFGARRAVMIPDRVLRVRAEREHPRHHQLLPTPATPATVTPPPLARGARDGAHGAPRELLGDSGVFDPPSAASPPSDEPLPPHLDRLHRRARAPVFQNGCAKTSIGSVSRPSCIEAKPVPPRTVIVMRT